MNAIGPALVAKHFLPIMPNSGRTVFAALSARVGSIADNRLGGWHGYRASKAGINVFTRTLAYEMRPRGILVNSVCPGWVKTTMGGPGASREVAEGAAGIVWAATLPPDGPTGGFFRDGQAIPW